MDLGSLGLGSGTALGECMDSTYGIIIATVHIHSSTNTGDCALLGRACGLSGLRTKHTGGHMRATTDDTPESFLAIQSCKAVSPAREECQPEVRRKTHKNEPSFSVMKLEDKHKVKSVRNTISSYHESTCSTKQVALQEGTSIQEQNKNEDSFYY